VGLGQIRTTDEQHSSCSTSRTLPRCMFLDAAQAESWLETHQLNPLAIISFSGRVPGLLHRPVIRLDLPELTAPPQLEVWGTPDPVHTYRDKGFSASATDNVLFGSMTIDELPGQSLDTLTELAYRRMLSHLQSLDYPYLWRVWNYFPHINGLDEGLERYQRFCRGRHRALEDMLPDFPHSLPAGTAVGTRSGPLHIQFMAGSLPAVHLGNPRQIHAYEYPQDYGPRSPSFARATLCRSDAGSHLYISGTASVVGHASRHQGLPAEQTEETINNLNVLMAHAEERARQQITGAQSQACYKVYIRHAADLAAIQKTLHEFSLPESHIIYLQGDLCRQELLVEIEGVVPSP